MIYPRAFGGLATFWIFVSLPFALLGRMAFLPWAEPAPLVDQLYFDIANCIIFFGPLALIVALIVVRCIRNHRERSHAPDQ
jgi:heme/copper-type cytochrome/quinol oxidase subunit 2